ncbi:hypothetical protein D8869_07015 [Streptococcus sanguinis]|jgi:hypothetical protein|uniref:Uncharacterized protein n=1 Tax=Streptococcus sanguinis TaxID=1305 RepID=A0AB74DVD2_STRSA|nr:hypothetical protein [Streptococcus sanguinis]RSI14398.1 hypothetical protein D8885_02855 [Streptococcus sanguinis]RSI52298.1 hypothetical protein D8869_07015 [Streptococcus sanguinis]
MKKAFKVDYFAIMHPIACITLPIMAHLFYLMVKAFFFDLLNILISIWTKKEIKETTDFLLPGFYLCIFILIIYLVGFLVQLIIHIRNRKENSLLPAWCMLTALIALVATVIDTLILNPELTPYAYFLSIAAYIIYFFSKRPKIIESYLSNAKIRYATWTILILAIILSFL